MGQLFKCSVCNVFFEHYGKATIHLGLRHSGTLLSSVVGNKAVNGVGNKGNAANSPLIVPVRFHEIYVVVKRQLADQVLKTIAPVCRVESKTSRKKVQRRRVAQPKKNNVEKSKSTSSPTEIKLDNMTASEIEGLIGGLVRKPAQQKVSLSTNKTQTLRSSRSKTAAATRCTKYTATPKVTNSSEKSSAATKSSGSVKTSAKSWKSSTVLNPPLSLKNKKRRSANEIKLDSLKASEIELLMNDLFSSKNNKPPSSKSVPASQNSASSLNEANHCKTETIDNQDEENSNFRRSSRRKKSVSRLVELDDDGEGEVLLEPDQDDEEYVPETKPKKRAVADRHSVQKQNDTSSSDDDQLETDYERNDEDIPMLKHYDENLIPSDNSNPDSEENLPPLLQRFDESDSNEARKGFPILQPYLRDRRKDKSKPLYKLQCRYCPAEFSAKTWFGNHMRDEHANANGKFSCNICPTGKEYTLRFLHKHFRRYHNVKDIEEQKKWEYTCKICGKKNQTLLAHESHERYHKRFMNPDNPFPCPVCPHRFSTKFNLTQHFNIHLENNPYQCTFPGCGKKFAGNYHLKRHYSFHIYRTIYKCKQCEATFTRLHRLENHTLKIHSAAFPKAKARQPVRRKKYAIRSLNIGFGSIKDVMATTADQDNVNAKVVTATAPSVKNEPEQSLAEGSAEEGPQIQGTFSFNLNHLPRHSNEVVTSDPVFIKLTEQNPELIDQLLPKAYAGNAGEFECHICGWKLARAYHLHKHLEKEHNMKPVASNEVPSEINPNGINLICGSCGFQASTTDDIAKHMKTLHPERNKVQCSYCNLRFKTHKMKAEHERKCHLTTPKFSCDKCPASFVSEQGCKNHMYLKHTNPSARFTCKTCGNAYHTQTAYFKHVDSHLPLEKRRFACNFTAKCKLCNQVLANKNTLRRHIQYVHLKAKNKWNEIVKRRREQRKVELLRSKTSTSSAGVPGDRDALIDSGPPMTSTDTLEPVEEINEILGF